MPTTIVGSAGQGGDGDGERGPLEEFGGTAHPGDALGQREPRCGQVAAEILQVTERIGFGARSAVMSAAGVIPLSSVTQ
ncbi:MAG: hypothetical protein U5N53_15015 [Mycobacterium sp.]|nr:hypothetical protein [Mycobacterium sp.]